MSHKNGLGKVALVATAVKKNDFSARIPGIENKRCPFYYVVALQK